MYDVFCFEQVHPGGPWNPLKQFCDGSAQSECGRTPNNNCLMYGANDKHMDVVGSALSGWLVFTVPKVREGIILIRMEWWCEMGKIKNKITDTWTEVNDGKTYDTTPYEKPDGRNRVLSDSSLEEEGQRDLKATFEQTVPRDLKMDIALNGKIVKTMEYDEWKTHSAEFVKNVALWPILDDISMAERDWEGEPVEVGIRFHSQLKPNQGFCISHVYYA